MDRVENQARFDFLKEEVSKRFLTADEIDEMFDLVRKGVKIDWKYWPEQEDVSDTLRICNEARARMNKIPLDSPERKRLHEKAMETIYGTPDWRKKHAAAMALMFSFRDEISFEKLRDLLARTLKPLAFHPDQQTRHMACSPYNIEHVQTEAFKKADEIVLAIKPFVRFKADEAKPSEVE